MEGKKHFLNLAAKRVFLTLAPLLVIAAFIKISSGLNEKKPADDYGGTVAVLERLAGVMVPPEEAPRLKQLKEGDLNGRFFQDAQVGDWLLIYPGAGQAVIFRYEESRLINLGVWDGKLGLETAVSSLPSVEVRNGTADLGLAAQIAKELEAKGYPILDVRPAAKNYSQSKLYNLKAQAEQAMLLAGLLNAKLDQQKPENEPVSHADILIIIGR